MKNIAPKVLLVEDDEDNQAFMLTALEMLGYQPTLAVDGLDAFNHFSTQPFDVVLMDYRIPYLDGYGATRRIRQAESLQARTPIIGITACVMPGTYEKCLNSGMDDYISKPIQLDQLERTIEKWLARS